jgi:signal transduction histidine kinase
MSNRPPRRHVRPAPHDEPPLEASTVLEAVLQQAADPIVVCDARGKLTFVNAAARRLALLDPQDTTLDIAPTVWGRACDDRGRPLPVREWPLAMALRGRPTVAREVRMVRPDGAHYDVLISAAPVRNGRGRIIGAVATFAEITDHKRAQEALRQTRESLEAQVRKRTAELIATNAALKQQILKRQCLEREVLQISEREQQRIGQEIHDGLSQYLAGIAYLGDSLQARLAARSAAEARDARRVTRLLEEAIGRTRQVGRLLFPVRVEAHGLMSALQEFARTAKELFRVSCRFHCRQPILIPDNLTATHLYRIAQESVRNAVRHGKASRVTIALAREHDRVTLTVRDNGKGIPRPARQHAGMGLDIMNYRASAIGGSLEIHRGRRGGTVVRCSLPLEAAEGTVPNARR